MKVKFWGVRGGIPVPGPQTAVVGGNTACVELRSNEGDLIILDAGSGIRALGVALTSEPAQRVVATILISHVHSDHLLGLPFFAPTRQRGNRFVIIGPRGMTHHIEEVMSSQLVDVFYAGMERGVQADVLVKELKEGEPIVVGRSVVVRARQTPLGGMGYRVSADGQTVAYACDLHHPAGDVDRQVLELAQGADLLIHDTQLTPDQRKQHPDWGHTSWDEAVRVAQRAGARRLALFHHSPDASDEQLGRLEHVAHKAFAGCFLAREGMELDLARPTASAQPVAQPAAQPAAASAPAAAPSRMSALTSGGRTTASKTAAPAATKSAAPTPAASAPATPAATKSAAPAPAASAPATPAATKSATPTPAASAPAAPAAKSATPTPAAPATPAATKSAAPAPAPSTPAAPAASAPTAPPPAATAPTARTTTKTTAPAATTPPPTPPPATPPPPAAPPAAPPAGPKETQEPESTDPEKAALKQAARRIMKKLKTEES